MNKLSKVTEFPFKIAGLLLLGVPCYMIAMMLGYTAAMTLDGWRRGFLS